MGVDPKPQRVWSAALTHAITKPVIAVVMGVSGSGKTTVAAHIAQSQKGALLCAPTGKVL